MMSVIVNTNTAVIWILTVTALQSSVNAQQQNCSTESLNDCLENFHSLEINRRHSGFDDVLPSWNQSELRQLCRAYGKYEECMEPIISGCSISEQLGYTGMKSAYRFLCQNTTDGEYFQYYSCFRNDDLRQDVDNCNETFNAKTPALRLIANSATKRFKFCEYYKSYKKCVKTEVESACGKDASVWQSTFTEKLHTPALIYYGCSSSDTGMSTATIIVIVFIMMTIFLMLLVIAVFAVIISRRRQLFDRTAGRSRRCRSQRCRRRRSYAPDYDAPYVVYGPPGPNGERRLRLVGLDDLSVADDNQSTVVSGSTLPFKGVCVQPPPYVDDPPPAFDSIDQPPGDVHHSADNSGFQDEAPSDSGPSENEHVGSASAEMSATTAIPSSSNDGT